MVLRAGGSVAAQHPLDTSAYVPIEGGIGVGGWVVPERRIETAAPTFANYAPSERKAIFFPGWTRRCLHLIGSRPE